VLPVVNVKIAAISITLVFIFFIPNKLLSGISHLNA
jgi:hypothetical protein